MVIVVELLSADQNGPRHDVGAGVLGLERAVAPVVADAVDDAGREERDPCHLYRPDGDADESEQDEVDRKQDRDADAIVLAVELALDPVIGCPGAVTLERIRVAGFLAIELGALPQDLLDAVDLRAVRIVYGLDFGVVLAVDSRPDLGHHAGGDPEPEAEEMADDGMQFEAAMRLAAVEVDGDAGNRDVGDDEGIDNVPPPRQIKYP